MTLQEEQEREFAILREINSHQMSIYRKEMKIVTLKSKITQLDWALQELQQEFRTNIDV